MRRKALGWRERERREKHEENKTRQTIEGTAGSVRRQNRSGEGEARKNKRRGEKWAADACLCFDKARRGGLYTRDQDSTDKYSKYKVS